MMFEHHATQYLPGSGPGSAAHSFQVEQAGPVQLRPENAPASSSTAGRRCSSQSHHCYNVLGAGPADPADVIRRKYRDQVMQHHPDKGGAHEAFLEVQASIDHLASRRISVAEAMGKTSAAGVADGRDSHHRSTHTPPELESSAHAAHSLGGHGSGRASSTASTRHPADGRSSISAHTPRLPPPAQLGSASASVRSDTTEVPLEAAGSDVAPTVEQKQVLHTQASLPTLLNSAHQSRKSLQKPEPLSMLPKSLPEAPGLSERIRCLAHEQKQAMSTMRKHLEVVDRHCESLVDACEELVAVERHHRAVVLGVSGAAKDNVQHHSPNQPSYEGQAAAAADAAAKAAAATVAKGPGVDQPLNLRGLAAHGDNRFSMPPPPLPPLPPPALRDANNYAARASLSHQR